MINNQYFTQCFIGTYVRGVLGSQWEILGVHFRPTRGVCGIHMSEDYFELGRGTGLKLGRMKESVWGCWYA